MTAWERKLRVGWGTPLAAYLLGGLLTFGWEWNAGDRMCSGAAWLGASGDVVDTCLTNFWRTEAILRGVVWPVYQVGRLAIFITR